MIEPAPPLSGMQLDMEIERRLFGRVGRGIPRYCELISWAWRVVEHLAAQGWSFTLRDIGSGPDWHASFYRDDCRVGQGGDTAPEAICRAALSAVGALTAERKET